MIRSDDNFLHELGRKYLPESLADEFSLFVESDARKAIILALFVYDLIAFVMTTITVISGILNPLGWAIVLIYLFFTIGFGYFLVKRPEARIAED